MSQAAKDQKIVLPSPNGARCSLAAQGSRLVCAGTIVNSAAAAERVIKEAEELACDISLVACGEAVDPYRHDALIRFALEDFLGAGAIAANVSAIKSPELRAAEAAFAEALPNLTQALLGCESGQEAQEMGFVPDVEFAARHNSLDAVAVFDGEKYAAMFPGHF
jgi:2-phosphosulfolactate phosphatase